MKKKILLSAFYIYSIFISSALFASNELSVLTDEYGSTKPGFIDKVVLVVEPHGGYFEQSLYFKYSDHNQFPGSTNIEIVHRFELPAGSVINDMWLWIGDSVMQAIMYDVWTATAIYDSIVTNKRDPALLKKKGNQYELHVYPLESGSYREVKINMITPIKWFGKNAVAELPFKMLNANNADTKPIELIFRQKQNNWGVPKIYELPQLEFTHLSDSAGYNYQSLLIDDISQLNSLKLTFTTAFEEGKFITGFQDKSMQSYFQLGILPDEFFHLEKDLSPKKNLFAIDLSGNKNKNLSIFLPNLMKVMNSTMKEGDQYKLVIAGADKIKEISSGIQDYNLSSVEEDITQFAQSSFADSISFQTKPNIIFADNYAENCWNFTGIEEFADVIYFNNIMEALPSFNKADIITAYSHGYDNLINQEQLYQLLPSVDSLFNRGGRLVTYFDHNRNSAELLARHFIPSLESSYLTATAQTLYRNVEGNIGINFPEQIDHNFVGTLTYDDPDVKIELMTSTGKPVIISKRIRNGLLVVVDIWQVKDDGAMKSIMSPPTLGLNKISQNLLLDQVLSFIKTEQNDNSFDKCILMTNSDSLYFQESTDLFVNNYLTEYTSLPKFNTINLLDASNINPPSILVNNNLYYGSGYLLNELSSKTGGLHFETYKDDWDYIEALSNYALNPLMTNLDLQVQVDEGASEVIEMREVNPVQNDPNKPLFFIAETNGQNKIEVNISATFDGIENPIEKDFIYLFPHDSTQYEILIPSLLANEKLKDMFSTSSYDTSGIVSLSIEHNLLTDYTALLVLEPNDTTIYIPGDDGGGGATGTENNIDNVQDSLKIELYPNPFNNLVNINLAVINPANISVTIYNILGQKVIELINNKIISGSYALTWNGKNSFGSTVSSGFYILRVDVIDNKTKKHDAVTKKLLYLK